MNSSIVKSLVCRWLVSVGIFSTAYLFSGCSDDSGQSEFKNVFGTDDRLPAPDQYPYRAVGRIDSGCTGTLISDTLVLTAAHCIVDSANGLVKNNLGWFRPNLKNNDLNAPAAWILRAWVGSENPDGNRLRDFAVIELDTPMGSRFGNLQVKDFNISQQIPFKTDLIGFSSDRNNGASATLHRGCLIREIVEERLFHDCDGASGVSGGPMLNAMAGTYYISAITVSEYRQGAPGSVNRDAYSKDYANVAIPAKNFSSLVNQLLATVARGQASPALPDITIKINPIQRPTGGGGDPDPDPTTHTVDSVASEDAFVNNRVAFARLFGDLRGANNSFASWSNQINDERLQRLARQLQDDTRILENVIYDTSRGIFQGEHRQPVFTRWNNVSMLIEDIRDFPRSVNRLNLEQQLLQQLSPVEYNMRQIEDLIF